MDKRYERSFSTTQQPTISLGITASDPGIPQKRPGSLLESGPIDGANGPFDHHTKTTDDEKPTRLFAFERFCRRLVK